MSDTPDPTWLEGAIDTFPLPEVDFGPPHCVEIDFSGYPLQPIDIDYVIYHGGCFDGETSRILIAEWLKQHGRLDGCRFHGTNDRKNPPEDVDGANLVIVDFSYDGPTTLELIRRCNRLLVLDHHKSAEKYLLEVPPENKCFHMGHSGATLMWGYLYGPRPPPLFVRQVEDRDIYREVTPMREEFDAWRTPLPFDDYVRFIGTGDLSLPLEVGGTVKSPEERIAEADEATTRRIVYKGVPMLEFLNKIIELCCRTAVCYLAEFDGRTYIYISANTPVLKSQVGNRLIALMYLLADFVIIEHLHGIDVRFSFRSTLEHSDVSEVAEKVGQLTGRGGGGHRNASATVCSGGSHIPTGFSVERFDYSILTTLRTVTYRLANPEDAETPFEFRVAMLNVDQLYHRRLIKFLLRTKYSVFTEGSEQKIQVASAIVTELERERVGETKKADEIAPVPVDFAVCYYPDTDRNETTMTVGVSSRLSEVQRRLLLAHLRTVCGAEIEDNFIQLTVSPITFDLP